MAVDYVVIMELIEHMVDPESLMREIKNSSKASIYITIPNMGFIINRLRLFLGGKMPITVIIFHMREHVRFWTYSDFKYWANSLGFKVVKHYGQNGVPFVWRLWPSLFARQLIFRLEAY